MSDERATDESTATDEPSAADSADGDGGDDGYGGAIGAFPYAWRASDSWGFRSYVAVAVLVVVVSLLAFVPALIEVIAATANQSASVTISRGWILIVWLGVVAPTVAPVLLVARRHRRERAVHPRYDPAMALSGYLFLLSLYAGLVATVPPGLRTEPGGALAPVVAALYALPWVGGVALPVVAAALEGVVHWRLG